MTKKAEDTKPDRRDDLLTAARKVFREKGYDGATVSDIVREAGVAQGTFYLYFPTKRDAFQALGQWLKVQIFRTFVKNYDRKLPLEERFRKVAAAMFNAGRRNADVARLLFFGPEGACETKADLIRTNPGVAMLAEELRKDMEAGAIEPMDPVLAARLLGGMFRNALLETFVLGDGSEAEAMREALVTLVVKALERRASDGSSDDGAALLETSYATMG